MNTDKIYQCECPKEVCDKFISTQEYEFIRCSGLYWADGVMTGIVLKEHLPENGIVILETETLYLYKKG